MSDKDETVLRGGNGEVQAAADEDIDFSDIPEVMDFSRFRSMSLEDMLKDGAERRKARLAAATNPVDRPV